MTADTTPPEYNPKLVERVILQEAVDLHPQRLTVRELALRIVIDPDDAREIETAVSAICSLKRMGLIDYRHDEKLVKPTFAALHAHELLAG
jgi:hypothetical protein